MPSKHFPRSPSSAVRWINCPGSVHQKVGSEDRSSSYATEGTEAHDLAERCLREDCDAKDLSDNKDMVAAVQEYLDEVRSVKCNAEILASMIEETVEHMWIEDFGGTPDHTLVYVEDGKIVLHIHDYKHGAGVLVEAEENYQALSYLSILTSRFMGIPEVCRVTIVQPRISSGDSVSHWETTPERVKEFEQEVLAARNQDHLRAGDWCRWCPALPHCPEVQKHAEAAAKEEFNVVDETTEKLIKFMGYAPAIKAFLDRIPKELLQRAKVGEKLPGMKVIERLSNRKWRSDVDIEEQLVELGVERTDFVEERIKTPPQLEKTIKGTGVDLSDLIIREPLGHAVVPESARGKPVDVFEFPPMKETNE
jgi:hypothetical protein